MKTESPTFDEPLHITGGVFYWKFNDYHVNPESGIFPQRLAALPVILDSSIKVPALEKYTKSNHQFAETWRFLFKSGNDPDKIFLYGRTMILLLSVVLGVVVYFWSKELFGRNGALISLTLYAFCPSILANARLTTSDIAISFSFIVSVWALWKLLQEISIRNILTSLFTLFLLFTSKMSAIFIIPVFFVMLAVRLFSKKTLELRLPGLPAQVKGQGAQLGAYLLSLILIGLCLWTLIWGAYGFRYSMLADENLERDYMNVNWNYLSRGNDSIVKKAVFFACENKLMPEAYLFGFFHTYVNSKGRYSFMNGEYSTSGWISFFPYCALVKTPIPFIGLFLLLFLAAFLRWKKAENPVLRIKDDLYRITPLLSLFFVYGLFAVTAQINIGLRHILLLYPILYILSGGLVYYFHKKLKYISLCICLLLSLFIFENLRIWPHYLAYFNSFAGGPDNAYKHLVDSSLDWGQDLPGLKKYLADIQAKEGRKRNVYLSYFGGSDVAYYLPEVKILSSFLPQAVNDVFDYDFDDGIFCISASRLQLVNFEIPWNEEQEQRMQLFLKNVRFFNETRKSPTAFAELIKGEKFMQWMDCLREFESLRLAKLASILRQREPDDKIGYSILIYKMPDAKLKESFKDLKINQ